MDRDKEAKHSTTHPRGFELPTEAFTRKTDIRDRGPPHFYSKTTEFPPVSTVNSQIG